MISTLASLGIAAALALPAPAQVQKLGSRPEFRFQAPLLNGPGIASLADLRGRPVLIDFWGTRCPACIHAAVPAALKLQGTFGDDLAVIFVEAQGAGPERSAGFALTRKWLGGRALWTSEVPVQVEGNMLPKFALLGRDGTLLLAGNPLSQQREIERAITEEIEGTKQAPPGTPKPLKQAQQDFGRGRWGAALAGAEDVLAAPAVEGELRSAAQALRRTIEERVTLALARIDRQLAVGALLEAERELAALEGALKGSQLAAERLTALRAALAEPARAHEREAQAELARILLRYYQSGGDPAVAVELTGFAARQAGTRAAERASEAARWAGVR